MKWLILFLTLIVAGAIIGPISYGNAGYVLVQFAGWSIETSVIGLVIVAVVALVIATLVISLVRGLLRRTKHGGQWFSRRRENKAQALLEEGERKLLDGDYLGALLDFEKAHKKFPSNFIAGLASYAAQQCDEPGKSSFWRDRAGAALAESDHSKRLTHWQQLQQQDPEQAAQDLHEALQQHPKQPELWESYAELLVQLGYWQSLVEVLNDIERYSDLSDDELLALKQLAFKQRFLELGEQDRTALKDYWQGMTRTERGQGWLRLVYASVLFTLNEKRVCAKVIHKGLKRGELTVEEVNSAGLMIADDDLVDYVQQALKRQADNPHFIRALALLAIDQKEYSLAQRALTKLVAIEEDAQSYQLLGDVYNALGDSQLAANAYKKALAY